MSLNMMDEFNLFEDLLPLGSLTGLSGSVEGVDDFGVLGSVFPDDSLKMASKPDPCDVLDLLSMDNSEDAFKDGWMENVDLSHFLDGMEMPDIASHDQIMSSTPVSLPQEESKQNSGTNILHGLLTQPIEQLTPPSSPEAQVAPELGQLDLLESMTEDSGIDLSNDIVEVESSLISAHDELDTSFIISANVYNVVDDSSVHNVEIDMSHSDCLIDSPLSAEEIDSILSGSEPASPSQELDPDYIPDQTDEKTYKSKGSKSKSKKARVEPYTVIPTEGLSKKEKKRIQNKNAAIRYRMKKKLESKDVRSEEDELLEKNQNLKEQVDQLYREIEYMKNLMSDVCKAKGLKIKFVKKDS